ncbi:hypothetical protein [Hydrogenophaga sp. 2FB]|uniref:hypothetical protein n=1 Tax=Hydrogenophaga sp. 2FB TaxID=2502187 RepID=UPI0010F8CEBD|nr:hypothetical protein [Hydrogenophaga sp. 2FB]
MLAAQLDPSILASKLSQDASLFAPEAAEAHRQALDEFFVYQDHLTHGANEVRREIALHRLNQFIDRSVPVLEALKRPGRPVREVNPFSAFAGNFWPSLGDGTVTITTLLQRYMEAGYISFRDDKIVTSWGTEDQKFSEAGDLLCVAMELRKPDLIMALFAIGFTFDNVPGKDHVFERRKRKELIKAGDACALVDFFHGDDDSPISMHPRLHALAMEAEMRRVILGSATPTHEADQLQKPARRRAAI